MKLLKPLLKTYRNEKGASMILALATTASALTISYFLSDHVINLKRQVVNNAEAPQRRIVLHSTLDYVLFAIKQKWCLSETFMPDRNCNLNHAANIERLLISPEQEIFLKDLQAKGLLPQPLPMPSVRLNQIEMRVDTSTMSQLHPLFKVVQSLKQKNASSSIKYISVRIKKETATSLPQAGKETFLQVRVSLDDEGGSILKFGGNDVEASTLVSAHPRELNSFALIVAGSLKLNEGAVPEAGDVLLPEFQDSSGLTGSPGLLFESPIFVNKDIHLPNGSGVTSGSYSPVTFAQRVYLGDGRIFQNGQPYKPSSAGGPQSQYWSDRKEFGGFLKGIENDGARDAGLDYLANPSLAATVDTSLMETCIARNLSRSDRTTIQNSELISSIRSETANRKLFRLGFSDSNEFSPQGNPLRPMNDSDWRGTEDRDVNGMYTRPVVEVEVTVGDQTITAQMTKKTELNLGIDLGISEALNQVRSSIRQSQDKIENWEDLINNPPEDPVREDLEDKVAFRQNKLNQELNRNPQVPAAIADAQARLNTAKANLDAYNAANPIPDYQGMIDAEEIVLRDLNLKRIELENLANNPPALEIATFPVETGRRSRSQPHLLDFQVKVQNAANFKDAAGNVYEPVIKIQAYDPTFFRSNPIGTVNPSLVRYLNLKKDGLGVLQLPGGLSAVAGTGAASTGSISGDDLSELDETCENARIATSGSAFGGASWDYSFAASTRHSWNFAGSSSATNPSPGPLVPSFIFDGGNSRPGVTAFQVKSIVGQCIVRDTAEFISGFFVCDDLLIEARARPLRIIGTFIVSSVRIDRSAFVSGIRWSSIHHPQATMELRTAGVLRSYSGANCDAGGSPVWHPIPSMVEVADRYNCNVTSLRARANPFQWTAVDPDCGYVAGNMTSTCKNRMIRFFVIEHQREVSL